jgi:amidase
MSLLEVAALIRTRAISPVDVTKSMLSRIERCNPELKAYVTVTADLAMEQASAAEREITKGEYKGLLHGVPVAVKDIIDTAGIRTMCGSHILADRVPDADATVVTKLDNAGAVMMGKLATTEFALYGYADGFAVPVNPWSADHWTGVSSSGSGAAVAGNLCFAALGTDTAGSIRIPSSACGTVGLKPTFGKVSRGGVYPLAPTLDVVGPLTRRVADAAVVLQALEGWDASDSITRSDASQDYLTLLDGNVKGLVVGVDENLCTEGVDPAVAKAAFDAATVLKCLGADIRSVDASGILQGLEHIWPTLAAEATLSHDDLYPANAENYGPVFRDLLEVGHRLMGRDIAEGNILRVKAKRSMARLMTDIDVLLLPTTPTPAIPVADFPPQQVAPMESFPPMLRTTAPFNFIGSPTINLVSGFTDEGLPLSVQFAGGQGDEATLLRIAHAFEQATEWHKKSPPSLS